MPNVRQDVLILPQIKSNAYLQFPTEVVPREPERAEAVLRANVPADVIATVPDEALTREPVRRHHQRMRVLPSQRAGAGVGELDDGGDDVSGHVGDHHLLVLWLPAVQAVGEVRPEVGAEGAQDHPVDHERSAVRCFDNAVTQLSAESQLVPLLGLHFDEITKV